MVAGYSAPKAPTRLDFALARYNSDGSLDTTFGTDGKVTTDFDSPNDYAVGMAIDAAGKVVLVGRSKQAGTGYDFAPARYNTDGSLDTTFGSGGKVTTDFSGSSDNGSCVAIDGDGKIVVGGDSYQVGVGYDFAVARYDTDGSLDTTFGAGGLVTTDFASLDDYGHGLAIDADGNIVLVGRCYQGIYTDFALARYKSDGSLDTAFGTGGLVTTDFGSYLTGPLMLPSTPARSWWQDPTIAANAPMTLPWPVTIATAASIPPLGPAGWSLPPSVPRCHVASGVTIDGNGKIVLAGYSWQGYPSSGGSWPRTLPWRATRRTSA